MNTKNILILAVFISCSPLAPSAFSQGSLTPPGPPAPTMKRLDEMEPRTNLQASPAPAGVDTTNATFHYIINQPGSYYLSANLGVTKANGIQINAEGVTLDLNGFEISRTGGSGGDGIQIALTAHRATVINGSFKGFAVGINGINEITGARACKFRDLSVAGCTASGIFSGPGALLESCLIHDSAGTYGLTGGEGSSMTNCRALNNTAAYPISAAKGSTVINCTASYNKCTVGIFADAGSSLIHCNALRNTSTEPNASGIGTNSSCTITACTASFNGSSAGLVAGFDAGTASTIQGCNALNNSNDGIRLAAGCVARDNTCFGNLAGIHSFFAYSRIEGNSVVLNQRGIYLEYWPNVVAKNSATRNNTNYQIAAGNVLGAIVDRTSPGSAAVSGNSAPSSAGTTDPWANIAY